MKIGQAAQLTGLTISNIRFYERKGLLEPDVYKRQPLLPSQKRLLQPDLEASFRLRLQQSFLRWK